jgi:hypothetical protein
VSISADHVNSETGCLHEFLTLREEHKLWVFKKRAQRRIFGPNGEEGTGGTRKLDDKELH